MDLFTQLEHFMILRDLTSVKIAQVSAFSLCTFMAFFIVWLLRKLRVQKEQDNHRLSEFKPEPVCPKSDYKHECTEESNVIDLARVNYLNLLNNSKIKASAIDCIRKYGVGTCGPRGFLGTTENHLQLEKTLAQFLGMEGAIIYSYGFAAPSNAIVGYCKKGDLVFCDEKINFALEQGLMASKALIIFFGHNNVADLTNKLVSCANNKLNSAQFSRFLLIEGIYERTGKVCPLPEMLQLAKLHKLRVFVDESISFGILGTDGYGIMQHFNNNVQDIDMVIGSLEGALGSVGSFCAGPKCIIEQQRLLSAGYVFSASLPAFQAEASLTALDILEKSSEAIWHLHLLCRKVQQFFTTSAYYTSSSDPVSPHKVFHYKRGVPGRKKEDEKVIQKFCEANGLNIIANEDGLIINVNVSLYYDKHKLQRALNVLKSAGENVKQINELRQPVQDIVKKYASLY